MKPEAPLLGWSVQWRSGPNNIDKRRNEHLIWPMPMENHGARRASWTARHPVWFRTRKEAREWCDTNYGYIRARPDLRVYPHDWKPPVVVRATLAVKEIKRVEPQRPRRKRRGTRKFPGLYNDAPALTIDDGTGRFRDI